MFNGGLFLARINAVGDALEANPNYIKTELGVSLRAKQDANTTQSIKDPAKFIELRNAKIQQLFDTATIVDDQGNIIKQGVPGKGVVAKAFTTKFDELSQLELPGDIVKSMATAHAARVYQEHIEILELEAPDGYKRAFGIATADRAAADVKNQIANTGISSYNSIAEYKSYKKNKKAMKKAAKNADK